MKFNFLTKIKAAQAFQLGMNALESEDPEEAECQFLKAAEHDPEWWEPHARLLDIYRATGRLDEAMKENLALCRLVPDEIRPNYYNSLGARFTEQHNLGEAISAFEKAIEFNPHYALPHANLAGLYFRRKDYDTAMLEARKAVDIDPNLPDGHYFVGHVFLIREDFDQALFHLEKAVSLAPLHHLWPTQEEQKKLHATIAFARSQISMKNHRLNEAVSSMIQAIELEPDAKRRAEFHRNLGVAYTMRGEHEEALAHSQEAVRLDPQEGLYHYSLGVDFTNLKRWEEACTEYRKALECGLSPELQHQARHNLGNAEHELRAGLEESEKLKRGGLKSAREFIEETQLLNLSIAQGFALCEEQGTKYAVIGAHENAGWLYIFLAYLYRSHGHLSNTLRCAFEACAQRRKVGSPAGLAESLILLAEGHAKVGELKEALDECHEVIRSVNPQAWNAAIEGATAGETLPLIVERLVNRTFEMPHRMTVELLDILGTISHKGGNLENADLCFQGARRILERTEFWQEKAAMLVQVGKSTRESGDFRGAQNLFDMAVQVALESNHKGNLVLALTERADIETYLEDGDLEQALKWIDDAILKESEESHWDPGLRAHFFYTRGKVLQKRAGSMGTESSLQDIRSAFVDYGSAVELVEDMRTTVELDSHKIGFLVDKLEAVHALIPLCLELDQRFPGKGFREKGFEYAERAKSRALLDLLEPSLSHEHLEQAQETFKTFSTKGPFQGRTASVEDTRKLLQPGEALIEYVLIDSLFAAFVVTPDSFSVPIFEWMNSPVKKAVVRPQTLREDVEKFLEGICHETDKEGVPIYSGKPRVDDVDAVRGMGRRLYDLLLRPVEDRVWNGDMRSLQRLVIVPHGILHRLPFSALFDGSKYLVEKVSTIQIPSASVLSRCCETRPHSPVAFTYFGLANPFPTSQDIWGCENVVLATARKLGYAGDWKENLVKNSDGTVFAVRRQAATRSLLLEKATQYACVDLETHGEFTLGSPLDHRFLLAGQEGELWFTAREIFQKLRLSSELLVAAMCHSGRLEVAGGDELLGLLRAFMFAGSRTILLYPWVMVDDAAELFMDRFYEELIQVDNKGVPFLRRAKDKAVRAAQMEFISRGRKNEGPGIPDSQGSPITWEHPHYWAWILYGDYQ
jgi:tetratricopeptide (TPR) repeat protein/CHAT domain-containing protein